MMAAARCKVSKWVFILGTLFGRQWDEAKLLYSAEEVSCAQQSAGILCFGHAKEMEKDARSANIIYT